MGKDLEKLENFAKLVQEGTEYHLRSSHVEFENNHENVQIPEEDVKILKKSALDETKSCVESQLEKVRKLYGKNVEMLKIHDREVPIISDALFCALAENDPSCAYSVMINTHWEIGASPDDVLYVKEEFRAAAEKTLEVSTCAIDAVKGFKKALESYV